MSHCMKKYRLNAFVNELFQNENTTIKWQLCGLSVFLIAQLKTHSWAWFWHAPKAIMLLYFIFFLTSLPTQPPPTVSGQADIWTCIPSGCCYGNASFLSEKNARIQRCIFKIWSGYYVRTLNQNQCMLTFYRLTRLCRRFTQPLLLPLDSIVNVCSELAHWALIVNGPQPFTQHTEAH